MFPWSSYFDAIDLSIESKDFYNARKLISDAIDEAERALIDPRFLIKQLKAQQEKVNRLEAVK